MEKKKEEPLKLCKEHYHEWKSEGYTMKAVEIDEQKDDCDICLQQEWVMNEGKEI